MPLLAICRGIQEAERRVGWHPASEAARGAGADGHRPEPGTIEEKYAPRHLVFLSGQLARIVGSTKILVNSLHGQGIDVLAPGLVVEATATDETIEAVRVERARYSHSVSSGIRNGATPMTARASPSSVPLAPPAPRIVRGCAARPEEIPRHNGSCPRGNR